MAENKGSILNKAEKILRRRKTQVLQSLGKTGKTTDEILTEDCQKLEKQQEVATRFQKDLRNYIQSARALAGASKTFYTTLSETYEAEWDGQESVVEILQNMDMLWQDYVQKLQDQVQDRLSKYLACIPQIKTRVAKSRRKLIDYDNAKHNLEVQENAKKKDDAKIAKAKEELEQAKKIYEDLNNDLHLELPEFYKSRVSFYGEVCKELFEAETKFHTECAKVWEAGPTFEFADAGSEKIEGIAGKLSSDNAQFTYTPRKNLRNTIVIDKDIDLNGHNQSSTDIETPSTSPATSPTTSPTTNEPVVNGDMDTSKESFDDSAYDNAETQPEPAKQVSDNDNKGDSEATVQATVKEVKQAEQEQVKTTEDKVEEVSVDTKTEVNSTVHMNGDVEVNDSDMPETAPPPVPVSLPPEDDRKSENDTKTSDVTTNDSQKEEIKKVDDVKVVDEIVDNDLDLYEVPPPAKPVNEELNKLKNFLYIVQATHSYKGEDDDELSFDCNEIIYVIEYDDPEEQDEGWLMGRKQDGSQGVFPANFTKKVERERQDVD